MTTDKNGTTRLHGDTGSAMLEIAILAPLAIGIMLLIAYAGRITAARSQVNEAARDAARSASFERDQNTATEAATVAAERILDQGGYTCLSRQISPTITPGSDIVPGTVTVTVACDIPLSDLGLIGINSASRRITAQAVSVFDLYRAGP